MSLVKQPPLHWPAWVWIIGHYLLGFGFLVRILEEVSFIFISHRFFFYQHQPFFSVLFVIVSNFLYFPVCVTAATTMLINRKIGRRFAFFTLIVSTLHFVLRVIPSETLTFRLPTYKPLTVTIWIVISALAIGVNIAWFVYFIRERKRYLPAN